VNRKRQELEILTQLNLSAAENLVPLPCIAGAQDRFTFRDENRIVLFHRPIMNRLLRKVDKLIARGKTRQLYVHAPQGQHFTRLSSKNISIPTACDHRLWKVPRHALACRKLVAAAFAWR